MSIAYQTILPDPNNPIGNAGQNTGTVGPGYKSVQLTSNSKIMKTRTNSGRVVARAVSGQHWALAIAYNPLTRAEFEPIYNFLLNQRGGLKPFFVSLPQYRVPQNATFATYAANAATPIKVNTVAGKFIINNSYKINVPGSTVFTGIGAADSLAETVFTALGVGSGDGTVLATAGSTSLLIDGLSSSSGDPSPGDMFTITDANDSNHTKTYRITQVETNATGTYAGLPQPLATERIIHFVPGLQKNTFNNATINFHNPLMRVTLSSDVQQYSLDVQGLYTFSLKLEEAQT
jgi:hypothetical protein